MSFAKGHNNKTDQNKNEMGYFVYSKSQSKQRSFELIPDRDCVTFVMNSHIKLKLKSQHNNICDMSVIIQEVIRGEDSFNGPF